jgi:hypothetical protein
VVVILSEYTLVFSTPPSLQSPGKGIKIHSIAPLISFKDDYGHADTGKELRSGNDGLDDGYILSTVHFPCAVLPVTT